MNFKIKKPIWSTKSVGLNENKLEKENTVEVLHRLSNGMRLYPLTYAISRVEAMEYPVQVVRGVRLRIVPINDMRVSYG